MTVKTLPKSVINDINTSMRLLIKELNVKNTFTSTFNKVII